MHSKISGEQACSVFTNFKMWGGSSYLQVSIYKNSIYMLYKLKYLLMDIYSKTMQIKTKQFVRNKKNYLRHKKSWNTNILSSCKDPKILPLKYTLRIYLNYWYVLPFYASCGHRLLRNSWFFYQTIDRLLEIPKFYISVAVYYVFYSRCNIIPENVSTMNIWVNFYPHNFFFMTHNTNIENFI